MRYLNEAERGEFLTLQRELILYTNQQFGIYDKFKTVEDLKQMDLNDIRSGIVPIRKKLYSKETIAGFCDSAVGLDKAAIEILKGWVYHYSGDFFILKHLKELTILMPMEEDKVYGVVGISNDLASFFPEYSLPVFIKTILLPFKDKIVYDGFFTYGNVYVGRSIKKRLMKTYQSIKGLNGIISKPVNEICLSDVIASRDESALIAYEVKTSLKEGHFPEKAWQLAEKNEANRLVFEVTYAQYYARFEKRSRKVFDEIGTMYYAMYRSNIIGVGETKKALEAFCAKHYPEISGYIYLFKA